MLFGACALLALIALRVWWGHEADRRLRAEIAAAKARGEPVLPADFQTPPTNGQTADKLLINAANLFTEGKQFKWLVSHDRLPLSDQTSDQIRTLAAANQEALDSIRRSRSLPIVGWGAPPGGEVPPQLPARSGPHLSGLARVLAWKALWEHPSGNDHEAAELILDLLHEQRVIDHGPPTLIVHLLALAVQSRAAECIFEIAPTLLLEPAPQGSKAASPATHAQVRQVIGELMAGDDTQRAGLRAWYAIRMVDLHTPGEIRAWPVETGSSILEPMYVLDALRMARHSGAIAYAAAQSNWPAAEPRLPRPQHLERSASALECVARLMSILNDFDARERVHASYRMLADRRAAAVMLGIGLFRADHGGEYPPSLNDLVPTYLPSVPPDPMSADNSPMRYRSDSKPPVVYSVGDNGKDDGGTGKPGADRWAGLDAVYSLEQIPTPRVSAGSGSPAPRRSRPR